MKTATASPKSPTPARPASAQASLDARLARMLTQMHGASAPEVAAKQLNRWRDALADALDPIPDPAAPPKAFGSYLRLVDTHVAGVAAAERRLRLVRGEAPGPEAPGELLEQTGRTILGKLLDPPPLAPPASQTAEPSRRGADEVRDGTGPAASVDPPQIRMTGNFVPGSTITLEAGRTSGPVLLPSGASFTPTPAPAPLGFGDRLHFLLRATLAANIGVGHTIGYRTPPISRGARRIVEPDSAGDREPLEDRWRDALSAVPEVLRLEEAKAALQAFSEAIPDALGKSIGRVLTDTTATAGAIYRAKLLRGEARPTVDQVLVGLEGQVAAVEDQIRQLETMGAQTGADVGPGIDALRRTVLEPLQAGIADRRAATPAVIEGSPLVERAHAGNVPAIVAIHETASTYPDLFAPGLAAALVDATIAGLVEAGFSGAIAGLGAGLT